MCSQTRGGQEFAAFGALARRRGISSMYLELFWPTGPAMDNAVIVLDVARQVWIPACLRSSAGQPWLSGDARCR
jgi:hypothetical protein